MTRYRIGLTNVMVLFVFILLIVLYQPAIAQEDGCSKFTVAVRIQEIFDYPDPEDAGIGSVFETLNTQVFKLKEDWIADIEAAVMAELKKNSPNVQFIKNGTDCDYHFRYSILNYPVLDDRLLDSLGNGPRIEITGYLLLSCIATERACIGYKPHLVLCNGAAINADRVIFKAIKSNIAYYGDFEPRLERYEKRFPAPARGPKINKSFNRDYVSPLEDETELSIRVQVTNCKGEPVFEKHHREQKVLYQRKTKRGELTEDRNYNYYELLDDKLCTGDYIVMGIYQPKGVAAKYMLQKGIEASLDSVEIKTCGRDKDDVDTAEVKIMGLELNVTARQKEIDSGDKTKIDISFNRVDTEGAKIPIAGKTVQLNIWGLVDGTVSQSKEVVTDERGRATLTYTAGMNDEEVTFEAKYQPKGFIETVRGKARVIVQCKYEWIGKLTFNQRLNFICDIDSTSTPNRTYLTATESQTIIGELDIYSEKIDIDRRGAVMLTPGNMKATGYVTCMKDILRTNGSESDNGNYSIEIKKLSGSKQCPLTEDNLGIAIGKDITGLEANIEAVSKEIRAAAKAGDVERIKELKIKMEDVVHGGKKASNQLTIQVQINFNCVTTGQRAYSFQQYDASKGEMVKNINNHSNPDVRLGLPIILKMDGTYTKDENGNGKITGSYSKSGGKETGTGLGPIKCPPMSTSISCNLILTKQCKRGE
ncbi:MAG: hypothetical protein KAR42_00075 [candidate division Zixibacteria bacterium]|nr:hypothetical protein [candidate division Zixibacteria bacterium]